DRFRQDRKYVDMSNYGDTPITAKMIAGFNDLPEFRDSDGSLESRMVVLPTERTWRGHVDQDKGLKSKVWAEGPGIMCWALFGEVRRRQQRAFTVVRRG